MGWKINIIVGILGAIGSVHVLLAPPWKSIALSVLLVMLAWGTATAWQENEKLRRNRSPEEIAADERDKQRRQDALFKFLKEHGSGSSIWYFYCRFHYVVCWHLFY